ESLKAAAGKFEETATKLSASLTPKANWIHLETQPPQCLPADQAGGRYDLVKYAGGTVLFENAGKNEWVQTGEMIQVGAAWRLVEGPAPGATTLPANPGEPNTNPAVLPLVEELTALDKAAPSVGGDPAALVAHHLKRADVLEKIIAKAKGEERDPWYR